MVPNSNLTRMVINFEIEVAESFMEMGQKLKFCIYKKFFL